MTKLHEMVLTALARTKIVNFVHECFQDLEIHTRDLNSQFFDDLILLCDFRKNKVDAISHLRAASINMESPESEYVTKRLASHMIQAQWISPAIQAAIDRNFTTLTPRKPALDLKNAKDIVDAIIAVLDGTE